MLDIMSNSICSHFRNKFSFNIPTNLFLQNSALLFLQPNHNLNSSFLHTETLNPLSANPTKWSKRTQTIRRLLELA